MARLQKLLLLSSISILTTQAIADPAWGDWQSNTEEPPTADTRPNVVFILTDDQDLHLNSLEYMPFLQKHLVEQGTSYQRHYCTIAVCCPSRVSLWTGQAAHNTNVTDVSPPYGGYPKFISQGYNEAWLPVWLQEAGYNTYYTGKLFNSHTVDNYDSPFPKGFTGSSYLLDPFTYLYLNSTFQTNQDPPVSHEGEYSTDVLASKAYGLLEDAVAEKKPFFLTVAPIAPHANFEIKDTGGGTIGPDDLITSPPIPADRHKHLFKDVIVPRTPSFNPDKPGGVSWIANLPKQSQENVDSNDEFHRLRLRSLQAVDEIIDGVVQRLTEHGILDNTYIIYSTDNGFHIGQHRLQPGKTCGFEEDINIPFIVRGPGVPKGEVTDIVTSHTDLAPTFLSLAKGKPRDNFDGAAIPLDAAGLAEAKKSRHEHVNVEYWGLGLNEGKFGQFAYLNNTYKSLRIVGKGYNFYYSVWCSGEHQLYNLVNDPYEMNNLYPTDHASTFTFQHGDAATIPSVKLGTLISRLDSLLLVLKTCKAKECTEPWDVLHPTGNVQNLYDALHPRYNDFYELEQAKVSFTKCEPGQILSSEGALGAKGYSGSEITIRGGHLWHEFV